MSWILYTFEDKIDNSIEIKFNKLTSYLNRDSHNLNHLYFSFLGKWWGSRSIQPIIAVHGWQDNAGSFDNLAPILCEEGHSVYAFDLPGHGHSSHLPAGCTYYLLWDGVHAIRY